MVRLRKIFSITICNSPLRYALFRQKIINPNQNEIYQGKPYLQKFAFFSLNRSSAFVQSEERSQPLPLWPPRSVHWVCLPKRLVTISPRPPKNGKVSLSCNFCGSDLKSLIHQLILKFIYRLEGHCQIDHSKSSS